MSLYKSTDANIARKLAKVASAERGCQRLICDLADVLTGPTSRTNAEFLAECAAREPKDLAIAMKEAAERYLRSLVKL